MLFQKLLIHPGLVIEPLQMSLGGELYKVSVALLVLGQDGEVVTNLIGRLPVMAAPGGQVEFAAYYGLYACLFSSGVKLNGAVQCPVVGDGQAVHSQFFGPLHQGFDATEAVQQAVLGMDMEVSKQAYPLSGRVCPHYSMGSLNGKKKTAHFPRVSRHT